MIDIHKAVWASLAAQWQKNPPAMQEMWVWSLSQEDSLEEEMATHSSILAWRIPWTEEPGGLQSVGLKRVGHDWAQQQQSSARAGAPNPAASSKVEPRTWGSSCICNRGSHMRCLPGISSKDYFLRGSWFFTRADMELYNDFYSRTS